VPRCVIQMSPGRSRMKASVSRRTPWKRLWTTMMRTTGECNASDGEEQLYLVRKQVPGVIGTTRPSLWVPHASPATTPIYVVGAQVSRQTARLFHGATLFPPARPECSWGTPPNPRPPADDGRASVRCATEQARFGGRAQGRGDGASWLGGRESAMSMPVRNQRHRRMPRPYTRSTRAGKGRRGSGWGDR